MEDEYKWKFINKGKNLNKDIFIIQNIKTNNYLGSGPHSNHKCGGEIYTNVRCGVEQIILLAGSEENFENNNINNIKNDGLILQRNFNFNSIKKSGCLFLACCYVGGLINYD